jgi:hypothetical protein
MSVMMQIRRGVSAAQRGQSCREYTSLLLKFPQEYACYWFHSMSKTLGHDLTKMHVVIFNQLCINI